MGIRIALCALAVTALAGCSTQTNPAPGLAMSSGASPTVSATAAPPEAQPAGYGVEATLDTIPWSQVGPGWLLATWSPLTGHMPGPPPPDQPDPETVKTALYLVDPQGGRYPITSFGPGRGSDFEVIDWSGDKSRALLRRTGSPETTSRSTCTPASRRRCTSATPTTTPATRCPTAKPSW